MELVKKIKSIILQNMSFRVSNNAPFPIKENKMFYILKPDLRIKKKNHELKIKKKNHELK